MSLLLSFRLSVSLSSASQRLPLLLRFLGDVVMETASVWVVQQQLSAEVSGSCEEPTRSNHAALHTCRSLLSLLR